MRPLDWGLNCLQVQRVLPRENFFAAASLFYSFNGMSWKGKKWQRKWRPRYSGHSNKHTSKLMYLFSSTYQLWNLIFWLSSNAFEIFGQHRRILKKFCLEKRKKNSQICRKIYPFFKFLRGLQAACLLETQRVQQQHKVILIADLWRQLSCQWMNETCNNQLQK